MTYWLLTTEYPPFHGGGISTYCHFTAQMLSQAGHKVTVFVPDDAITGYSISSTPPSSIPLAVSATAAAPTPSPTSIPSSVAPATPTLSAASIPVPDVRLIRFNSNRNNLHNSLGYTARLSYAFADMVRTIVEKEGSPDIIEAQDYLGIAYYLTQFRHLGYAFLADTPIVITLHSPAFIYLEYNRVPTYRFPDFWTGEMERQSIKAADLLISPTRFLVEEIQKYVDISDCPLQILANPYGLPATPYGLPAAPNLPAETPGNPPTAPMPVIQRNKIVYYGKLSPQKGSFELLAYFKDLWEDGFPHALHIIGGTDIVFHPEGLTMGQLVEQRYRKYIEQGLLQLHGRITPAQISQSLADAHLILVPSIVDNLPYVVMEAMSLGKIVLASVQGGQREMITDGVDGFLFDHTRPDSFRRQLLRILELDDRQIQQVGIAARRSVHDRYAPEKILPEKMALLQPLLHPAAATPASSTSARQPSRIFPFVHQEKYPDLPPASGDLLSVVIPYYNMGAYIEECIQSIQVSTYPSLEIIIVNDGSTDPGSLFRLEQLTARSGAGARPLIILHQKNTGLAGARNNGARAAKGDYLAFLDADDKVAPVYYEKTIRALQQKDNVFFAGSWVQYFEDSDALWPAFTPQPPYALVHNPVNSSGLVYRRAAFLAGGLNDKHADYGLEDYESVVNMLHHGFNGVILPEPLFYYRVRKGSMFRQVTTEKLLYSNKYILQQHTAYYAKFATQIINLLNANGPGYQFDNPTFGVRVSTSIEKDSLLIRRLKSIVKSNEWLKRMIISMKHKLKP